MRTLRHAALVIMIGIFFAGFAFSQEAGDYRSAATGNWSDVATWETFDGADWVAAGTAPTGTETITVNDSDSVRVDIAVAITGYVAVTDTAIIEITDGSMTFDDGSTYEHARDGGSVPDAEWGIGSTFLITGTEQDAPAGRDQDFYNVTFNTPDLGRNRDMSWNGNTIGGDVTVVSTGSNRWQMTSASGGDSASFTIMGDVIVQDGNFAVQGTGNALTVFEVHHFGNINVTGGNFSVARGSQGSGTGSTTWILYEGNFSMSNATTQNSNPTPGNAKFVFAKGDTQQVTFQNVEYGGGDIHYEVSDSSTMEITEVFRVNGLLVNKGAVTALDSLIFIEDAVYEHARDGGNVPSAYWMEGSTALFTGITGEAPENRGQDYYNLILNTPDLISNRDLSLDGNTISGDITVLSTGSARWQLVGGSSGTVTIMGDVIVEDGQFATQGTGSATDVVIDHYGDINVTGGNFAVSRGSQSSGAGTTTWNLHEGNFMMSDATTQNSNPTPGNAKFVFTRDEGSQDLWLSNVTYGGGGLSIQVDSTTTLNADTTTIGGNGVFILSAGATLATANVNGADGAIQTSGEVTISKMANVTFNGTEAQTAGALLDTLGTITVANLAGVAFNDTLVSGQLVVETGALMTVDTLGSVTADSGSVAGTVVNKGVLEAINWIAFEDGSVYEHARNAGDVPTGVWSEGSTFMITGTVDEAPGNRNQGYYNMVFNTPDLSSNRDMSLDDVTIGGDIRVIDTGGSRWRLTSASGGDTAIVTIMGDVIVEGGSFETQGTGNALTVFEVHQYGDVIVTGGTFAVSRGSQGDGSGSTRWFMHEGDFSITGAQTRNSNPTNAWFVFDSDTVQTITLVDAEYGGGGLPIVVAEGTTLDFGLSQIGGNGLFGLEGHATLATANAGGVDSTLQTEGDITLSDSSNFVFNGTEAQVTGELMPAIVNNLTINNEAGVTHSQETTINGVLRLIAGVFDNTIPFTLGPDGSVSYEGGSLLIPTSVAESAELPTEFALFQNYPNPFNPSTTVRYDVPEKAHVSLKVYDILGREVAELVNDQKDPGNYEAVWDARSFASGIYFYRITAGDFVSVRKLTLMK